MNNCTPIFECLACGSHNLSRALDLGNQPLANNFRDNDEVVEQQYPLVVNRCNDCDHLQLTHAVDPKIIYTHYLYVSGTARTYIEYMDWYAGFVSETITNSAGGHIGPYSVLDVGCNDGSQLNAFRSLTFKTYGIDPAENLHPKSSANHEVVCGFFSADTLGKLSKKRFDVISNQNAFAHLPNPLEYLTLAKEALSDIGRIFISTSQADMVLNGEFDTIYHEHISFYNAESMRRLAERAGLHLVDVVKTPIHGTSYIFILAKQPLNRYRMSNILGYEQRAGLHEAHTYHQWSHSVDLILKDLKEKLDFYKQHGYTLVGYGAAAKGMTLLNASGVTLDAVIDDNPLKQGTWCPGVNTPVVDINYLDNFGNSDRIVFVPLAWNFYNEIVSKIHTKRNSANDRFVRYFPKVDIQ